jgi:hypothetical protein
MELIRIDLVHYSDNYYLVYYSDVCYLLIVYFTDFFVRTAGRETLRQSVSDFMLSVFY